MKENSYFYTAMYLRLSKDDREVLDEDNLGEAAGKSGESKAESNSISSKREMIRSYIREQEDMELYDSYVDDGFSGSNYDRPEFKRMMCDIEAGRVNCVIVKDLSRFGRNYLEAGNYIEKIFPFLGVRFIAVADGYDTGEAGSNTNQMATEVKNLINDMYAKDFSGKARLSLAQRRQEGSYVGGPPPYTHRPSIGKAERSIVLLICSTKAGIRLIWKFF